MLFTPEDDYVGIATVRVQADDGFAVSAPIELTVSVSGAKLLAIHLAPLSSLRPGQSLIVKATADFEDQKGVDVSAGASYLTVSRADISGMGLMGQSSIQVDDSRDLVRATGVGAALIIVTRIDTDGRTGAGGGGDQFCRRRWRSIVY
ncbi:hypothetical protein LP416_08010 [Polaromonas sp. P2-4]|nr:hypothetical protein LP416_08010 [Polaromonas sp. P2-4]